MLQVVFNRRQVPKYILALGLIFVLYFIFSNDLRLFLFLTHGVDCIIGVVVMTIAINTYRISQNTIFTFLAISLGFCGFIEACSVVFNYYDLDIFSSEYVYLQIFIDFLSISSLILCSKLYNKNFNFKYVFFFYFVIVSSFVIALFLFKIFPSIYKVVLLNFTTKDMLNFILFVLSLYPIYNFIKIKDDLDDNDLKSVFSISIFFIVSMFLYCLPSFNQSGSLFTFMAMVSLSLYVFFTSRVIIRSVLKKPYNMVFYNLDQKSREIEKSKNCYKTLVESLPLATIIIHNYKIIFVNLHSLELFKYSSKVDLKHKEISSMVADDCIYDFNENYYKKNEFFKTKLKTSSGSLFEANVRQLKIIFDEKECTLMLIKDISHKKKIDELNRILERKLEEENLRTEFFSNLSHELRTPINVIYSVLQLEDIYIKNNDMKSIEKHNKTLKQNCLRLLRICNNLIDVTKIDAGYFSPDMKCVNIVNLIENIVSSVSVYTQIRDMDIVFDTESEEIYVLCDSDLIERIILNLISNSIKYGSQGGNIWVNIYDEGGNVKILFVDDGPGIPKSQCEDMFERFIQVDKSFNRCCEGSGLGLSLVKSLVELHNGTINLESDAGLGCKFTIVIPHLDCDQSEVAVASDDFIEDNSLIDKIHIEFSDIYF